MPGALPLRLSMTYSACKLAGTFPNTEILVEQSGHGLDGVYAAPVPLPAAAWLLAPGLVGLLGLRQKFGK